MRPAVRRCDLQNRRVGGSIESIETGVLQNSGAEKIPSNPNRIIPAWEVSEAAFSKQSLAYLFQLEAGKLMSKRSAAHSVLTISAPNRVARASGHIALLLCASTLAYSQSSSTDGANESAQAKAQTAEIRALALARAAQAQASQPGQSGASSQQAVPQVTTTVVVHSEINSSYEPADAGVGTLPGLSGSIQETPLSITVATRSLIDDQGARLLSDVVKNDASIGEDYAPVGYYGDFTIRGFPIDLATGLEVNGVTIAGEQDVPLENKEQVEFLKGIAGVESGVASSGGLIDYVTKRPALVQAVDLATDHRGTAYGAIDLGRLLGDHKQVGVRFNAAGERIASYVEGH